MTSRRVPAVSCQAGLDLGSDAACASPVAERPSPEFVLNGIAYLPQSNHLLITGKCWPRLYEIELIPEPARS